MKLKKFGVAGIILTLLIVSSYTLYKEANQRETLLRLLIQQLNDRHYQPQTLDDEFSEDLYDGYIKRLDFRKRYFTQADLASLETYRKDLDDQTRNKTFTFFDKATNLYLDRIKDAEAYVEDILSTPFDFSKKESYQADPDKISFAKDEAELKESWRKMLKYQTLARYATLQKKQEDKEEAEQLSPEEMEKKAREKVLKSYQDRFHTMGKYNLKDYRNTYINSLVSLYDPHTSYFPPRDKADFDIQFAGELEGIGARLVDREGFVTVTEIVPGSPSYRQGELEVGDAIIKVGQGEEEAVDIEDMRVDEAVLLIRGKKGTEVRLTVRKKDGNEMVIPIVRDIVKLEETYAKSAILQEEGTKDKIGYIYLPQFYKNFAKRNGRSCSKDVKAELEKLKAEQVTGVILDLRTNGGGSLQDVVEMVGHFIEKGPVVQVKSRNGKPYILTDKDPSVYYDGSLVILVNTFSASASEIMAAAIQDYGRGIIIGSNNTYGKGTVQQFQDLDEFNIDRSESLGAIKLTIQKFYRINGDATQLKGVTPDIILPDSYSYMDLEEKDQEHALDWDAIQPVNYQVWTPDYDLEQIIANSKARVKGNETFKLLNESAKSYKSQQDNQKYPLQLDSYMSFRDKKSEEAKKYEDMQKVHEDLSVVALDLDLERIKDNEVKMDQWQNWMKELQKDAHIYEALQVIQDMNKSSYTNTHKDPLRKK
ncbi:MAG: carboxy terminal-processing peptidase [Bacteroidota bacterium]